MKFVKGDFVIMPNKSALKGLPPNQQVLFFWLCNHSDDSMKSFPSRQTLAEECGMSVDSLDRAMRKLVELKLIRKTPRRAGVQNYTNLYEVLLVTAESETSPIESKGVAAHSGQVAAKTTLPSRKNDPENYTHLTQPIEHTTNVVGADAPPVYGKAEINELFQYWQEATGVGIESKRQANRNACNNLYRKFGAGKLRQLIDGVALAQNAPYAPRIADFIQLQSKLTDLLVWGKSQQTTKGGIVKI